MLNKKLISFVTVCAANCLVMAGLPASADVCTAIQPHLDFVEQGTGSPPVGVFSLGLGEDSCKAIKDADVFKTRVVCSWDNTPERSWTADDARDIGQKLNQSCYFLTTHFNDARHSDAAYFLWYGDYTGVVLKVTGKGLTLTIQVDEEAFYFS